jgi:ribonuclease HI
MRKLYVQLLEEVIKQEIASNTVEFKAAIEGLRAAKKAAVEAKEDIEKVAQAIERFVRAAKAVDKVVGLGIGLLA